MATEGLGTKNLVADAAREVTGRTHYETIAQDTVAMIVNDLVVVGAMPKVVTAHFAVGKSSWFNDRQRAQDLLTGWASACELAGATWGGGETPTLKDIVNSETIELSGSATGEVRPKDRLLLGDKIEAGDRIILIGGTGLHANGYTLAREIAEGLPNGYGTGLEDGTTYGEALLRPTPIYVNAVRALFEAEVELHYLPAITGHGWRKIMRAEQDFSYVVEKVPTPQPVFNFIQEQSGNDDQEMYGNFNMGAGLAAIVAQSYAKQATEVLTRAGYPAMDAGEVIEGPKQVVIEPKGLVYASDSLSVR
jgi:phosphoribosylformylglycinamidine cyclo-ligase